MLAAVAQTPPPYDLLIRNARVVDGTGNPWFRGDVAIKDGRIAAVGVVAASAKRVIDARERLLAPGFIDIHTHVEDNLESSPAAENFLRDGVTTVVTGNCGGSNLDIAGYFRRLPALKPGVNVATFIGHNTVRREVMGTVQREATQEELSRMSALVDRAMQAGAIGLSTGLEYIPGAYAPQAEIVELAKVAARYQGLYTSHMRNEGRAIGAALDEALAIGRQARIRVEVSHIKLDTRHMWGKAQQVLAQIDAARQEGIDVTADLYPYDHSATSLSIRVPAWALAEGKLKERLADPATKAKIIAGMKELLEERGHKDYGYARVVSFAPRRELEGKTIVEIAGSPSVDAQIETILTLLLQANAGMVYQVMSLDDMRTFLAHPHVAVASDGGVRVPGSSPTHPRSYGANARVFQLGVLGTEETVRRMTSLPARTAGIRDRGLIRPGLAADLVLFDPAKVRDQATYVDPHQYARGFDTVIVNGVIAIDDGRLTAERGGRPLARAAE